jgi:hypothetical protein
MVQSNPHLKCGVIYHAQIWDASKMIFSPLYGQYYQLWKEFDSMIWLGKLSSPRRVIAPEIQPCHPLIVINLAFSLIGAPIHSFKDFLSLARK